MKLNQRNTGNIMQTSANKFEAMGKEALRAACRAAGVSYGKLDNAGMRAILLRTEEAPTILTVVVTATATIDNTAAEEVVDEAISAANPFGALLGHKVTIASTTTTTKVVDGKVVTDKPDEVKATPRQRVAKTVAPIVPRVSCKGYTIQKERETRNGMKRPSEGTVCGAVWSVLDAMYASAAGLKASDLPALADENGWNRTNVSCEFYAWRKFNGINGRK